MTNDEKKPLPPPVADSGLVRTKSTLSDGQIQRYRDSGSLITLEPGETLIEQGSDAEEMYVVARGVLGVYMDGVQIGEVFESQVVGEMAFILQKSHTATVRALTVCEVHAISPQKLRFLLRNAPEVIANILTLFALRTEAVNHALRLRTQTATDTRLALTEEKREHAEDVAFVTHQLGTVNAENAMLQEQLEAAEARIGDLARKLEASKMRELAASTDLAPEDDRITDVHTQPPMKVFGAPAEVSPPTVEQPMLALDLEELERNNVPKREPIARVAVAQIAVPRTRRRTAGYADEATTKDMKIIAVSDAPAETEGHEREELIEEILRSTPKS